MILNQEKSEVSGVPYFAQKTFILELIEEGAGKNQLFDGLRYFRNFAES